MTRWLKAFLCVALVNLALSVAMVQAAPLASKRQPVMAQNTNALKTDLVRRVGLRRRIERLHTTRAVIPAAPWQMPQQLGFDLPRRSAQPPLVASAPPDHPPA